MEQRFMWGAGTSAHQVEGNNTQNDWWRWEQKAGHPQSGKATDHYNRYREDFAWAKKLGHNAHRLSIEWSRIEPKQGRWNTQEIHHYREVLTELRRLNLQTWVTLHHFTNPIWFANKGGWENKQSPHYFSQYVQKVMQELGDLIDVVTTINEPMVYATQSYWQGHWYPQKRNFRAMVAVLRNLAHAHRQAFHVIRRSRSTMPVGIAQHVIGFIPGNDWFLVRMVAAWHDYWFNYWFLSLIDTTYDYIGLNYYFAFDKEVRVWPPKIMTTGWDGPISDMGWSIRPEALPNILLSFKKYKVPLYITENGVADATDTRRADFIRDHLRAIEQAQRQGADVRGYFYWSLLDNFEWTHGFEPRFGLLEVDYATLERKPRKSAFVYKAIIEQSQRI